MSNSAFIKKLFANCKMHGSGDAQVIVSDTEIYSLICIAVNNLGWSFEKLGITPIQLPDEDYYRIPLSWFEKYQNKLIQAQNVLEALQKGFEKDSDFVLFIENLSALHRRRVKYKRILSTQPAPTMDQIGPRVILEYGECDAGLLANWMMWRKWIYDIDNRSAQETGYLFEPLLASCLGGEPIGAKNSPIKRLDPNGEPTTKGRQIDCLVPSNNAAYEFKLRVTIAASGQGRFGEELSFPAESQAAGFRPILLVLDPTPSPRLTELSEKFLECGGRFYSGEDAWCHMKEQAGKIISIFIDKYLEPTIKTLEQFAIAEPQPINLSWTEKTVVVSMSNSSYTIERKC